MLKWVSILCLLAPAPWAAGQGLPTNAVYGFTGMLRKLLRERRPDYAAVVFDPPEPPARRRLDDPRRHCRLAPRL